MSIESYRAGAEVYNGHNLCKEKSIQLLEELCLPKGLLPLEDIKEFGYNQEAGFIWLIQNNKTDHSFQQLKRTVTYAPVVTAFVEKYRITEITGVKTKEFRIWFSIVEVYIEDPTSEKLTFKSDTGLVGSFPASAFELED